MYLLYLIIVEWIIQGMTGATLLGLLAGLYGLWQAAIWAFSLQQIVNRAYYSLRDTFTPLVMSIVTLAVNLLVELPLLWTPLAEAGMEALSMAEARALVSNTPSVTGPRSC